MGIVLGIIALIAAGCLIAYAVALTIKWLSKKISEKLAKRNVKKVAVADLQDLINQCENKMSMSELDSFADQGYTHLMAEVGNDGKIINDVDLIKDTNDSIDSEVEELLNRTNQGMVIIEG